MLLVGVILSPFQVYPDVYDHMLKGTYAGNKAVANEMVGNEPDLYLLNVDPIATITP